MLTLTVVLSSRQGISGRGSGLAWEESHSRLAESEAGDEALSLGNRFNGFFGVSR